MPYQRELDFFCRLMNAMNIRTARFPRENPPLLLENAPDLSHEYAAVRSMFTGAARNTLYFVYNPFAFSYAYLLLPDTDDVLLIGPYMSGELSDQKIMSLLERHHMQPSLLPFIRDTFSSLPQVQDESVLFALCSTLCDSLFGGMDAYEIVRTEDDLIFGGISQISLDETSALAEAATLLSLEERYEVERHLMHLVSQGRTHRAQMIIRQFSDFCMDMRTADPLRNTKNYGVVLHTLLRKAVENGGVHPLYIDRLSAQMARRLEGCRTIDECMQLFSSMVHKYCLLVKNHSMKHYSMLVQHVILRIDSDLTADLSLKAHAEALSVNPSYLSTLFKRETGQTLTEFVACKRIDNAIYLLNSTDMQVQTIAQYCGIPDVNYFTKTFKRLIGCTPKEYRQNVRKTDVKK